MRPVTLQLGQLRVQGASLAGIETWFRVHPPGLAFEAGRGSPRLAGAADVFLSHGHLDHALGVPYLLSQRTRHQGVPTRLFCPSGVAEPLEELIRAAGRLEETEYDYGLTALAPGDRVDVGRGLAVEAFATDHVVPSLGYHLISRRQRLLADYRGLPGSEIARLRAEGVTTTETLETLALSYCGDTGSGVFELEPRLFETQVLMIECTFLNAAKRESAARYKHVHFEDLVERAGRFRNRSIVLHHLSRRHRPEELREAVDRRLPELASRIHVLGAADRLGQGDPEPAGPPGRPDVDELAERESG